MTPFIYNTKRPAETLDQFNERLRSYCTEAGIAEVVAQSAGGLLVINVLEVDGLPVDVPPILLCPQVLSVPVSEADDLEDFLNGTDDEDGGHKPGALEKVETALGKEGEFLAPIIKMDTFVIDKQVYFVVQAIVGAMQPGAVEGEAP